MMEARVLRLKSGVLEEVMRAGAVVNEESGSLESADNFFGFDDRYTLAHAEVFDTSRDGDCNLFFDGFFAQFYVCRWLLAVHGQAKQGRSQQSRLLRLVQTARYNGVQSWAAFQIIIDARLDGNALPGCGLRRLQLATRTAWGTC